MARKFNIGRQSEHILNKEMYDMFMSMKYLNSGNTAPTKDEQTDIPNGALWLENYFNKPILNSYSESSKTWGPVFQGHYHPADVFTKPSNPVNGQLWIDHSNGDLLHYYDNNTSSWIAVSALSTNENPNIGAYNNFVVINPLSPSVGNSYLVPNEVDGKLFDENKYIHPNDSNYTKNSSVTIDYISKYAGEESWIHVNHKNLNKVEKRLIKLITDADNEYAYTVELFDHNTEFYGIDTTTGLGTLLLPNYSEPLSGDYIKTDYGIKLLTTKYEYIYAITYGFGSYSTRAGQVVKRSGVVGSQDTIYIGPSTEHVFVFLDGLYLEQDKYTHDRNSNSIIITGDDITQLMDLTAVTFPDYSKQADDITPLEFTINQTNGALRVYATDPSNSEKYGQKNVTYTLEATDAVVGPLTNAKNFRNPMAFVGGVHADVTAEPKDVIIENDLAIIKNIGPLEPGDTYKVMIVEGADVYLGSDSVPEDKTVRHHQIDINSNYMLYVDGVLVSPRDLDISDGEIRVAGLMPDQHWTLLKVNENNDTAVMFDSAVSHYSIKIEDDNEATIYNNCDCAIVYCGEGILVDRDSTVKYTLPAKGVNGQIIAIDNGEFIDEASQRDISTYSMYCQWSKKLNKWIDITDTIDAQAADLIMNGYIANKGSISIINSGVRNKSYTYHAYTFINSVDEPLQFGTRTTKDGTYDYKVNLRHDYLPNTGSLITYINGLRVYPTEQASGIFTFDEIQSIPTTKWDGTDLSKELAKVDNALDDGNLSYLIERPENNESVSYNRVTLAPNDRIDGHVNTYETSLSLLPGYVTAYINGVRLPREEFTIIDENTITFHREIIGGQSANLIRDPETWNKYTFNTSTGFKQLDCVTYDRVELEVRQDFKVKELTIPVRYAGQTVFNTEDDGIPKSLLSSQDFVKVFINGIFYGNEYEISEDGGYISLTNSHALTNLGVDPIDAHFRRYPEAHEEYQRKYGKTYVAQRPQDYITFEWR